jgi:hypothetical protein
MLELFIELTNQIFWDGYAEQLSTENPAVFKFRFNEFVKAYNEPKTTAAFVRGTVSTAPLKKKAVMM